MGAQGEGAQGPKPCKFQSSIFFRSRSRTVKLCSIHIPSYVKNTSCSWQFPEGGPNGPGGGGGGGGVRGGGLKSNCFIYTSFGVGDSELFKWYTWPHGAPGPQGRAPIAFLIDDIPLGAPQVNVAYVNSGER